MLFNSWHFLLFVLVVLALDSLLFTRARARRMMLLAASYFFYAQWNWQYLGLIAFTTLLDFHVGQRLRDGGHSGRWLALSLTLNLSILAVFKYADFAIRSANAGIGWFAPQLQQVLGQWSTLDLLLPIGISFYTFQSISYTVDLYRGELNPRRSLLDYALFVSFFPQLVAGPIERAGRLLPQVEHPRAFDAERITLLPNAIHLFGIRFYHRSPFPRIRGTH